jgi:hypothetical protein
MHLNMTEDGGPRSGTALPWQCGLRGFAGLNRGGQPTVFLDHDLRPFRMSSISQQ